MRVKSGHPLLSATPPTISITMTSPRAGVAAFPLPWQLVGARLETFLSHDGLDQWSGGRGWDWVCEEVGVASPLHSPRTQL